MKLTHGTRPLPADPVFTAGKDC